MAKLVWHAVGQRFHEIGVDRGVLFIGSVGHPWDGLVSVEETPTGGEARPFYIDGVKYLNLAAKEEFEATISAFYSPVEFDQCEGLGVVAQGMFAGQQRRAPFGLSYRTKIGNDTRGYDYGYKIHLIYNALVAPTTRKHSTIGDNSEVPLLSWPITTQPVNIPGMRRSAHIVLDSTKLSERALNDVENMIYGYENGESTLPTPAQLVDILTASDEFTVTSLGNGLWSISGSSSDIISLGNGQYEIINDGVVPIDEDTATISSD